MKTNIEREMMNLLAMFIKDGYSIDKKISKETALAMEKFIESDGDMLFEVNNGTFNYLSSALQKRLVKSIKSPC